jgi:hypothetical protein
MRGVSNPFLALPTNRAAKPGVHRSGYGPVADLLTSAETRARDLLTSHQEALSQLTTALLEQETITGDQVRALAAASPATTPAALPAAPPASLPAGNPPALAPAARHQP